jgi:hypothetical protein
MFHGSAKGWHEVLAGGHGTTVRGKNPKQKWLLQNKNTKIHTFKIFIVIVYHAITQTHCPSVLNAKQEQSQGSNKTKLLIS